MSLMSSVLAVICILLIVFLLICLECVLRKRVSYVVSSLNKEEETFEAQIRDIISKNPSSEILIFCTARKPETIIVLEKLKEEFSQLHILQ